MHRSWRRFIHCQPLKNFSQSSEESSTARSTCDQHIISSSYILIVEMSLRS